MIGIKSEGSDGYKGVPSVRESEGSETSFKSGDVTVVTGNSECL